MNNQLLSVWRSSSDASFSTMVLPDGCRDLIFKVVKNRKPEWFVSPLFDHSKSILVEEGSKLVGFRMRPGIEINESKLLRQLAHKDVASVDVDTLLDDFTHLGVSVTEALECLASDVVSIKEASIHLGVSLRTLQRLILAKTGKPPGYWFQLARVRKAAKELPETDSLCDLAEAYGFSDQSHMTREFQRWFRSTPSTIKNTPELIGQLLESGYP